MKKILIISPNSIEDHCDVWINESIAQTPYKQEITFDFISPENPISENVTLLDCLVIKQMLCKMDLSPYEGMILIHGTEYIPFTAAALSILLTEIRIPLFVITQNALLTQKANYRSECFNASVAFILQNPVPGVFNITKNELLNRLEVHHGDRISQTTPFDFQYIDILSGRFGDMIDHEFHFLHGASNPTMEELLHRPARINSMKKTANILYIRAYRRMPYHYYNFALSKPAAVLHELYDLTSILANEGITGLTAFSAHCKAHNVTLYLCPLVYEDLNYEEVLAPVLKNGAVLLQNITVFSAYAKLVYGYGDAKPKEYLTTTFSFENFTKKPAS